MDIKAIIFDADGMVIMGERFSTRFSRDFNVPLEKIRLFFDFVIASSDVGFKKPQKEFFEHLMEKLPNVKKNEILFFDDREENVKSAQEFGFNARVYKDIKDLKI